MHAHRLKTNAPSESRCDLTQSLRPCVWDLRFKPVVLNLGASSDFQGHASSYMLYNMESFWKGLCLFQTWLSAMWLYTCMIQTFYSTPIVFFGDLTIYIHDDSTALEPHFCRMLSCGLAVTGHHTMMISLPKIDSNFAFWQSQWRHSAVSEPCLALTWNIRFMRLTVQCFSLMNNFGLRF